MHAAGPIDRRHEKTVLACDGDHAVPQSWRKEAMVELDVVEARAGSTGEHVVEHLREWLLFPCSEVLPDVAFQRHARYFAAGRMQQARGANGHRLPSSKSAHSSFRAYA